jgi:GTPase Era involved in 16S rRNA processing
MRYLNEKNQALLAEERQLLSDLRVALVRFGAAEEDQKTLDDSIRQLDDFFLLVIVGEFNAGKSSFINALLGKTVLKEGVTPTTTQIHILRYGEQESRTAVNEHLHELTAPAELLVDLSIVDTPGTRADLVLFVTSADRPFTESERDFLEKIRDWGKKVVLVVNKVDILEREEDLAEIRDFIEENARTHLGMTPEIFPISARAGLRAKQGEPQRWAESRMEPLESFVHATLDEESRMRLKFMNPLGVGEHLVGRYLKIVNERLTLLTKDFQTLEDVDRQLVVYKEDMQRDFEFRMSDIEKILYAMENRGDEFFDETIRIARVMDLVKKDRIQHEFEVKVVGEVPHQIESRVGEMIDWLVEADLKQWQAVTEHLADRRREHKDRIIGEQGVGTFHYDRERLIDGVGREARRVVDEYDKTGEARNIAEGVQSAVAAAAVLEVGAVGLGVLVSLIATTVAADVTGILMASFFAVVGFFVLPARRRAAKREMHEKVSEMRLKLSEALRGQFEKEIERSLQHIQDAISPYTRFIRAEREKLEKSRAELNRFKDDLTKFKGKLS